jgi:hypothetical protein
MINSSVCREWWQVGAGLVCEICGVCIIIRTLVDGAVKTWNATLYGLAGSASPHVHLGEEVAFTCPS